jgi:glutathione S-transferase
MLPYDSGVSGNGYEVRLRVPFWPAYARQPAPPAEVASRQAAAGHRARDTTEAHLAGREFLLDGGYAIADISLYAHTPVAGEGGFDLAGRPTIRRRLDRLAAQPGDLAMAA